MPSTVGGAFDKRIILLDFNCKAFMIYCLIIDIYRMSQELRSLLQDLIPELILSQKCHTHTWVQFATVQEL